MTASSWATEENRSLSPSRCAWVSGCMRMQLSSWANPKKPNGRSLSVNNSMPRSRRLAGVRIVSSGQSRKMARSMGLTIPPRVPVYLNTQVWAVLSGAATESQARACMETLNRELSTDYGLQLCAPPVTTMPVRIMAARLFNPGTKENAGIFNHPQGWAVIAECMLGNGNRAYQYHSAYLPAKFNDKAEIRGSEPYVHCQSTHARYSPMHGAARLPWLTGAAHMVLLLFHGLHPGDPGGAQRPAHRPLPTFGMGGLQGHAFIPVACK